MAHTCGGGWYWTSSCEKSQCWGARGCIFCLRLYVLRGYRRGVFFFPSLLLAPRHLYHLVCHVEMLCSQTSFTSDSIGTIQCNNSHKSRVSYAATSVEFSMSGRYCRILTTPTALLGENRHPDPPNTKTSRSPDAMQVFPKQVPASMA